MVNQVNASVHIEEVFSRDWDMQNEWLIYYNNRKDSLYWFILKNGKVGIRTSADHMMYDEFHSLVEVRGITSMTLYKSRIKKVLESLKPVFREWTPLVIRIGKESFSGSFSCCN